jgi:hypothetical protein
MKKLTDAAGPAAAVSEVAAITDEAVKTGAPDYASSLGTSCKRQKGQGKMPKDMSMEEILEAQPKLEEAALFVVNLIMVDLKTSKERVHASWEN